jgi:hypothetical protein
MTARSRRLRSFSLWLLLWGGLGLFFASEAAIRQWPGRDRAMPWSDALLVNIPFYLLWGVLALGVLRFAAAFPITGDRRRRVRAVLLHLAVGLAVAALHLVLAECVFELVRQYRGRDISFATGLAFSFRHNFPVNVVTYWSIVGVFHLVAYYRGLREKELVASRLEEQLARAELSALRMQLQPHFLFNALNSISELVYSDPAAADRMLVRLSDLLRRSLETTRQHEVPLEQELDFLQRYLEIERMRYPDRLQLQFFVDEFVLDAAVPTFLLQPLVENAVVHGVGRSRGPCRVSVRARREADELYLEVENDLPPGAAPGPARRPDREGVGLQNTRARLAQLYGDRGRLELELRPEGIALARVVLPFRELDGARHVRSR